MLDRCRVEAKEEVAGVARSGRGHGDDDTKGKRGREDVIEEDERGRPGRWKMQRLADTAAAAGDREYLGDGRRLVQHPRAKHGLLRGWVDRPAAGVACSVWSHRLPLWLPAAMALGMTVQNVSLSQHAVKSYGDFVRRHYPAVPIVAQAKRYSAAASIVLCDDRRLLPPKDHYFWSKVTLVVISEPGDKKSAQNLAPSGWKFASVRANHPSAGGVTTAKGYIIVLSQVLGKIPRIPTFPPASMALIMSDVVEGRRHFAVKPPAEPATAPILVKAGRFSAFGLLPSDNPRVRVVAPSVFSKPQMVMRQLTADEICKAWDLPTIFVDNMMAPDKEAFVSEASLLLPTRLLHDPQPISVS